MNLKETIRKVLREERRRTYTLNSSELKMFEKLINRTFREKFDWFKSINVSDVYIGFDNCSISAELEVDMDWFYKQFREFHYSEPVPDDVRLGDIIDQELGDELREEFAKIVVALTGIHPSYVGIGGITVKLD